MGEINFSIVIPVHNGANYLAATLKSILDQTYQNFDLLILENASQDRTVEIIQSFQDSRIQLIPSNEFLPIEQNWGRILDLELNEYLCIFCHDDVMHPNYLQEMVLLIEAEPQASLYHTQFEFIDTWYKVVFRAKKEPFKETGAAFLANIHQFREDATGSGYVARSVDFKRVGGFPPLKRLLFSDFYCWYRLAQLSYKVCSANALYGVTLHQASTGRQSQLLDFYAAGNSYLQLLPESERGIATDFLAKFYRRWQRLLLEEVIFSDQPERLQTYKQLKQQILTATNDSAFVVSFDHTGVRLREQTARLPVRFLRIALLRASQVVLGVKYRLQQYLRHYH